MKLHVTPCVFLLFTTIGVCNTHTDAAYMRQATDGFTPRKNWMSEIRDDVLISEMAIPGTHGSAAYDGNIGIDKAANKYAQFFPIGVKSVVREIVKNNNYHQTLNFKQQLLYGIRVFDIRFFYSNNELTIMQGGTLLETPFEYFLEQVANFLAENLSETILIPLIVERDDRTSTEPVTEKLDRILKHPRMSGYFLKTLTPTTTLGEARGKFIIYSRGPNDFLDFGMYFYGKHFQTMDHGYIPTIWDLYSKKWKLVRENLLAASAGEKDKYYVTYLHGWGGAYPYFVASGHTSPETSATRRYTGLISVADVKGPFPDFPRKCLAKICFILFEGINILTRDRMKAYNQVIRQQKRTVGIIMADFPGDSLIATIIENNALLKK